MNLIILIRRQKWSRTTSSLRMLRPYWSKRTHEIVTEWTIRSQSNDQLFFLLFFFFLTDQASLHDCIRFRGKFLLQVNILVMFLSTAHRKYKQQTRHSSLRGSLFMWSRVVLALSDWVWATLNWTRLVHRATSTSETPLNWEFTSITELVRKNLLAA